MTSAIAIVAAALCTAVFVVCAIVLTGAALTARGLPRRAEALGSDELRIKLQSLPDDLNRIASALQGLIPLLARGALAVASIASGLAALRRQLDAVRRAFGS